jgi:hypothetical protein
VRHPPVLMAMIMLVLMMMPLLTRHSLHIFLPVR